MTVSVRFSEFSTDSISSGEESGSDFSINAADTRAAQDTGVTKSQQRIYLVDCFKNCFHDSTMAIDQWLFDEVVIGTLAKDPALNSIAALVLCARCCSNSTAEVQPEKHRCHCRNQLFSCCASRNKNRTKNYSNQLFSNAL
ncbi:hypothetical protein KQX54_000672 [Cotesia glomerata]|uniref:Uncharacterized protein n=1 Tax=Cotesia glomerata TaxID=32391 RepID=A0AAV7HMZ5_COTGL|nr:hypothetical protein KQX54_000672 [Cotesia glomerata]